MQTNLAAAIGSTTCAKESAQESPPEQLGAISGRSWQKNSKLVIDAVAGNEIVKFPYKWLSELEDDEKFLHTIDVLAEF